MKHLIMTLGVLGLTGCGANSVGQNPGYVQCSGKVVIIGSVGVLAGGSITSECSDGATLRWGTAPPSP